jgi:hypothetical protein
MSLAWVGSLGASPSSLTPEDYATNFCRERDTGCSVSAFVTEYPQAMDSGLCLNK